MEQVFGLVNELLKQSFETRERNLNIRTYKVVPLTPTVGIVEWVQNTDTIGGYLLKTHTRLQRPGDMDATMYVYI